MARRKWQQVLQWLRLALIIVAFAAALQAADVPQGIVLIGWDGAQRNHVKEMLAANGLPNLAALSKDGTMVDIDVVTGRTDTKAGWAQILTGYTFEKTGIYSNTVYQPIPEGYTVFERLEKFFGPDKIATVAIVGKKDHVDADGPQKEPFDEWQSRQKKQEQIDQTRYGLGAQESGKVVEENGVKYALVNGKPYFHAKDHMTLFKNGLGGNQHVGAMALEQLEKCKDKRFFFFIHFLQPDSVGHRYGENSQEYTDGIKADDQWTGKIIDKLKELNLYDKVLVYVTADHGFDEGKMSHSYAPYIFLATNDKKVNRNGVREDITPTILKRFGLELSKIEPKLDGYPLDEPAPERKAPADMPSKQQRAADEAKARAVWQ